MSKPLPKNDPTFCIIAPTPYLEYTKRSKRHLVLAHIVDTNPVYGEFYKQRSAEGDFIIMDNGAFELGESYAPEKLIELGIKCGADAIVLPDYPFKHSDVTVEAAIKWGPQIRAAGFKTMFVPQSQVGDLGDWIWAYTWAAANDDIDIVAMSILGIPNALPHIPAAYARVVMTQLLIDRDVFNKNKYHHYLGLNAGPNLEIPPLLKMGALDSLDSSNPVWMGILGHEYSRTTDSYLSVAKVKKEVEFDYPLTKDLPTIYRVMHNIELTMELFDK